MDNENELNYQLTQLRKEISLLTKEVVHIKKHISMDVALGIIGSSIIMAFVISILQAAFRR